MEIILPLTSKRANTTSQTVANVSLFDLKWEQSDIEDTVKDEDDLRLGLKKTQVVILNDIGL